MLEVCCEVERVNPLFGLSSYELYDKPSREAEPLVTTREEEARADQQQGSQHEGPQCACGQTAIAGFRRSRTRRGWRGRDIPMQTGRRGSHGRSLLRRVPPRILRVFCAGARWRIPAEVIELDTLASRLRAERDRVGAPWFADVAVAAWARTPAT